MIAQKRQKPNRSNPGIRDRPITVTIVVRPTMIRLKDMLLTTGFITGKIPLVTLHN